MEISPAQDLSILTNEQLQQSIADLQAEQSRRQRIREAYLDRRRVTPGDPNSAFKIDTRPVGVTGGWAARFDEAFKHLREEPEIER